MRIKRMILELLPPWIFFSLAIGLLRLTQSVILQEYGIERDSPTLIIAGSLLISRALVTLDRTRLVDRYAQKPLLYGVLWKTALYFVGALLLEYLSNLLKLTLLKHQSWEAANLQQFHEISQPRYWVIRLWLAVLLLNYCFMRELIRKLGKHPFLEMLTGKRNVYRVIAIPLAACTLLSMSNCASTSSLDTKEASFATGTTESGKISEAQLQDSLFRFANRFSSMIQDDIRPLENNPDPKIRSQAMLRRLIYMSTALDVALGPSPQANLLDMVALVELSRAVWKEYWIPQVFGQQGALMNRAFDEASKQVWALAAGVLDEKQRTLLSQIIAKWRRQNPDQVTVENVRLTEFARESGARASRMNEEVSGLLSAVKGATQIGDRALLFSERALFYAQRAPFLWRLQARSATRDVLSEAMETIQSSDQILNQEPRMRAILGDLNHTLASLERLLAQASEHPELIRASSGLVNGLANSLHEWNSGLSNPKSESAISRATSLAGTLEAGLNRFLLKFFGVGAALIVLAGFVSLGSRLAYSKLAPSARERDQRSGSMRKPRRAA